MSDLVARVLRIQELERPGDGPIAELADLQHGVVAYWQLIALGFTRNQIDRRERSGHLHRVHRGVYAVGRRKLALKGRWMGAVLAGGPDAVLSHHSAAVLWDLRPNPGAVIHVTAPGRTRHGHKGIKLHSVHELHPDDRRCLDGIPVTSVHRTLLDFAETARRHELGWAFDAAARLELLDLCTLDAALARSPGRRGVKPLRKLMTDHAGPAPETRSELERSFLALMRDAGIPEPSVNVTVAGVVVDFFWPEQRLVVEIDGYLYHRSRQAFEGDRRKDTTLQLAGYPVLRFTERRMKAEPGTVQRIVLGMLSAAPAVRSDR